MKTNHKTKHTPSVVSTPTAPVMTGGFTIGLDLGDRSHYVCVLDATGQILHEGSLPNERVALALLLTKYPAATMALEAGTHSAWISRYLTSPAWAPRSSSPIPASFTPSPATNASATAAMP